MSSIKKIHTILELLRENNKTGLTNKEISITLKIPQSSCYRILASLNELGYVQQRGKDKSYILGFAHLRFAQALLASLDENTIIDPFLEELHQETGLTTFFSRFNGNLCISMSVKGSVNARISVGIGEIMPFNCSSTGKVILAFIPEKQREKYISGIDFQAFTNATIVDSTILRNTIQLIHSSGIAYNLGEMHQGINSLATPIFDSSGMVFGAITVVGTAQNLPLSRLESYSSLFYKASRDITAAMGGRYPLWIKNPKQKNI